MNFQPHFTGHVQLYYGPPGTGKTEQFMRDLEKELETVPPERIAYFSFTREGAYQGVKRALKKFPQYQLTQFPYFRTSHSIAFHALNLTKDQVISRSDYREFSQEVDMNFAGYYMKEARSNDDRYMFFADAVRNNRELAAQLFEDLDPYKVHLVQMLYKQYKEQMKLLDFTDMISRFIARQEPLPIDVAFIDEAQDFTTLLWRMADVCCRGCKRIYIAGDDDQAIYQWAGADIGIFLNLKGDKKVLNMSHRFGENIRKFASGITDNMLERIPKEYHGKDDSGRVQLLTDMSEVPLNLDGAYLFLFRNIKFIKTGERMLQSKGLVYTTEKGMSVDRVDYSMVQAWNTWLQTGTVESVQRLRIQNLTGKQMEELPKQPWQNIFDMWPFEKIAYLTEIFSKYGSADPFADIKYTLRTIHTAKGSEAENVVLFTGMSDITYNAFIENPDPEHRVWYVGATRAKENLFIVPSGDSENYPMIMS